MARLSTTEILNHINHRSWKIPKQKWSFYQEWNKAIFLHWEIAPELLEQFIPKNLQIDTFKGKAWISLVAFTMKKIRPRQLPSFAPISKFHEINLRTYVIKDHKPGVYFLNIEAEKLLSAYIAKKISGLPYEKSNIKHDLKKRKYTAEFKSKSFKLDISYEIGSEINKKTELDIFLTERYCLYLEQDKQLIRYEIHHLPWEIKKINCTELTTKYTLNDIDLNQKPNLTHYSNGIQVVAWNKEVLTN